MAGRRGFTLLEITLVMAIIIITMALASPLVFEALYSDTKVTAAADAVRASWAQCRAQAIEEGRPYAFCIIPNSGRFKICPYELTDQGLSDPTAASSGQTANLGNTNVLNFEDVLPTGVRFATEDTPVSAGAADMGGGDFIPIAVFLPDGSAQEDVEVIFSAEGAGVMTLKLRALTGTAVIVRQE